jgi:hypothetical protein
MVAMLPSSDLLMKLFSSILWFTGSSTCDMAILLC